MANKFLSVIFCTVLGILPVYGANAALQYDTEDPMFLEKHNDIVSRSSVSFHDSILRVSQYLSYGVNSRLALSADIKYQEDFNGDEDGFSNFRIGGTYRLSGGSTGDSKVVSDALFGIKFGGTKRVREPEFADTIYYAGVRVGRQWSRFTLAGTVKTSWIFDEDRGMAYIELNPEAYLRITDTWTAGAGFNFLKATDPNFDQEWLNLKLVKRYGSTQYVGHVDYEFEADEWLFGVKVNILF